MALFYVAWMGRDDRRRSRSAAICKITRHERRVHAAKRNAPSPVGVVGKRCIALRFMHPTMSVSLWGRRMPHYRRMLVPGGEYFFTVNLEDRSSDLLTREIALLRSAWLHAEQTLPFETVAAVVLPDHLHCIWRLPHGDADFSGRWRMIKAKFTRGLKLEDRPAGRRAGEYDVWQRRFWEHAIRDDRDRQAHIDYIHNNPVKHGHCSRVDEWPYSTWRGWDVMIADDPAPPPYAR